ncbi:MAG: hypothetical protein HY941_09840 [Gammaproteobacteria bacterium]|nr:hypothetical protein [Gammaproteobacteria bacterium]
MSISRRVCSAFIYAFAAVATVSAAPNGEALPPLSSRELAAVVGEIEAMVKTDESQVSAFVVREATPSRIDRLFAMPELAQLDGTRRENALIFAGRGTLLRFDKPSDIVAKVASWFPGEVAAARASSRQSFFGYVHLYGPYADWQDEPAAFLTLWNCMPQIAWLKPDANPFMRRLNDSLPFMAIAARSSSELDFGQCVRERSGLRPAWTEVELPVVRREVRAMSDRVTPVLRDKFARFLAANRCRGTGPDDCALILMLWASLSPADAELAAAIQMLEAEVSLDSPLPELQHPAADYGDGAQDGEPRFDAALRRAAFLRAKLISVLNAPAAWPSQALPISLHQLTRLQQRLDAAIDYRRQYYELDYYNEPVNPWTVFARCPGNTPQVRAAILAELNAIGDTADCAVYEHWFKHGGTSLQSTYALQRLRANRPLRCASPDWAWLQQGRSREARALRNGYLALLGRIESGALRDRLLSGLTENGQGCFDQDGAPAQVWRRAVCTTWIGEPQAVQRTLEHSGLTLRDADVFRQTPLESIPAQGQATWLLGLVQDAQGQAAKNMRAIAAELDRRGATIYAATTWNYPGSYPGSRPEHSKSLVELRLNMTEQPSDSPWPFMGTRILLAIEPHNVTWVGVPQRFGYQYDDGEITHVSDLDADGNLEVWLSGTFGECDGEDLRPGVDCAIETIHMGEIAGDAVSYFADTSRRRGLTYGVGVMLAIVAIAGVFAYFRRGLPFRDNGSS